MSRLIYLDEGVPAVGRLIGVEGLGHALSVGQEGALRQALGQPVRFHLQGRKTNAPTRKTLTGIQ